jgi:hypothetical protein
MPAFGASQLDKFERILESVLTEAEARGIGLTRELAARRLFDAARSGMSNEAGLRAAALGGADNDDEPFPPDLGMRPIPPAQPIWPVAGLAA